MIGNDWDKILDEEYTKPYFMTLINNINTLRKSATIYPKESDVFKSLELTPYSEVKVVIIGQDPYHGENQANGLAFAVNPGVKYPPSLKNIIKELETDLNIKISNNPDFTKWSKQGVLLLNTILTVEDSKPGSHQNLGWEKFTNEIINKLNQKETKVIFVLWGSFAQTKETLITGNHIIIKSVHPSPLSAYRGFFGSKPFSKINKNIKNDDIDWVI